MSFPQLFRIIEGLLYFEKLYAWIRNFDILIKCDLCNSKKQFMYL
jgi:hypothetical protein